MKHTRMSSRHTPKRWGVKKAHKKEKNSLYNEWMYTYTYTRTRIYIHTYIYTSTYTHIHIHTHLYTYTYIHILQGRHKGREWVFMIYELHIRYNWNTAYQNTESIPQLVKCRIKFREKRDLSKCRKYVYLTIHLIFLLFFIRLFGKEKTTKNITDL